MNIIFFGNTKYSLIDVKALHEHFGLTAIVTIPDRENIHKKTAITSPTKLYAVEHTIPVIETVKLTNEIIEHIKELRPEFLVVADYRFIIPQKLLELPKTAPLNIHHSLLPKYRGPGPAPTTILKGDTKTGVTVIKIINKVDAGDIYSQKEYVMRSDETTDSLLTTLNELGAQEAINVIENFYNITPIKQDESQATVTRYITKQDGYIDLDNPPDPIMLDRMIRAYYPWPNTWSKYRIKNQEVRIKLLPGKKIQVEGKKPQTIKDFINGYTEGKVFLEKLKLL